jgi:hypothetical protein
MTFDPSVPNAAQSPGLFPAQNNTNYTRVKTIINADHVFNDTAQSTDGVHRQMTLISRAHPVALPAGTNSMLYSFSGSTQQLWFYDGASHFQMTPTMPIRAAVAFNAAGVIQSQVNVSSVVLSGTSIYTITFTIPMPNANYIVQVCGMRPGANTVCNGGVLGNPFASSVTQNFVKVVFNGGDSSQAAIERGYVTIFSET